MIILLWNLKEINSKLIVKLLWSWMRSTFKTLLYKIVELVIAYNGKASNKTLHPRTLYALHIGPIDSDTGHLVFKISTEQLLTTPKCKLVPIPEDVFKHMFDKKNQSE